MSKKFFLFVIGGFGLVLVIVLASLGGFGFFGGSNSANSLHVQQLVGTPAPPGPPPPPSISLTIRKLKTGNSLIIQWTNLPVTTAALDLFCSSLLKPEPSSSWTLWKEILLSSGELAAGDREVQLGVWYKRCSFYVVQAVTAKKVGTLAIGATTTLDFVSGVTGGNGESTVLWTSGITLPGVTTSTVGLPPPPAPNLPPPPPNQNGNGTPSSTNPGTPNPTSTPPAPPASTSTGGNPTSTPIGGVPPNTPSGTPYYNPQVQIVAYAASGSPIFWVQHKNQGIEIGWQNIPPETDTIVILRSNSADGPWIAFMTQQNLPTDNYSIQLVDSSLSKPYYYQMQAIAGSSTVAFYGPDYLAPGGNNSPYHANRPP